MGEKADTQAASKSPGKNAGKGKKRTSDAPSKDVPKKKPRIAKKKDDKTADVRSLVFLYALFLILVQKTTKGKGKVSKQVASPVRVSLFFNPWRRPLIFVFQEVVPAEDEGHKDDEVSS